MKTLPTLLSDYLLMRRTLGAGLMFAEWVLNQFLAFLANRGATIITTELAREWAFEPVDVQADYLRRRLAEVRHFARYAHAMDPRHEIPPDGLPCGRSRRRQPYIYSDTEMLDLIAAASRLSGRLRPMTCATLLGLLWVTGMRSGEVARLDRDDVDLLHGRILIRNTKFGKSRMLLCHETTRQSLIDYAARRDRLVPAPREPAFFVADRGARVWSWQMRNTFAALSRTTGLRGPDDSHGPRLHDIRHSFAVRTLLRWYRDDVDVERRMPHLSTWLGHVGIDSTYWYLTAVPELMEQVALRLDRVRNEVGS